MKKSKFIVLAAPSGSGKTTLVNKLLTEVKLNLEFSISATSRKPRKDEINGKNYFFLSKDDFLKKIENNEFLEWEEVYKDTFYGTLISELEVSTSKNIIFDSINFTYFFYRFCSYVFNRFECNIWMNSFGTISSQNGKVMDFSCRASFDN